MQIWLMSSLYMGREKVYFQIDSGLLQQHQ